MEINRLNTSPIDDKYWEVLEEYSYETSKGLVVVCQKVLEQTMHQYLGFSEIS